MTSRTLRRFLVAVLLVCGLLLPPLVPALASVPALRQQAGPVVIDFEDLDTKPGFVTSVTDQYADLGVTFNDLQVRDFAADSPGEPAFAHSGSQAAQQCFSEEFCRTPLIMTFSEPQRRVKVWVGIASGTDEAMPVTMTAFNAATGGDEIASTPTTLGPSGSQDIPVQTPLEVTDPSGAIRRVVVGYSASPIDPPYLVFDDVEFEPAPAQAACPAGAAAPVIALDLPTDGDNVQIEDFTVQGRIETSAPLTSATLSVANTSADTSANTSGVSFLDVRSRLPQAGGAFGPFVVDHALRKGTNRVTLTVANCADTAKASASIEYSPIKARTRYEQLGLEVTQTIQDSANSVRLIADKPTFVRVYLRAIKGEQEIRLVTGRLRGCVVDYRKDDANLECLGGDAEFQPLPPLDPVTVNAADDLQTQRDNLRMPVDDKKTADEDEGKIPPLMNYGLLFELPPEWRHAGHLRLQFDAASLSPRLPCVNCDAITEVEFFAAQPLVLNLVDTWYEDGGTPLTPRDIDHQRVESWLERAYPTAQVTVSMLTELPLTTVPRDCHYVNAEMFAAISPAAIASPSQPLDARARYYGLVASGWRKLMEGCTTTSPDGSLIDRIASGPVGSGDAYFWDIDGSYADFYAGHEIGHTFGRKHPGECWDESPDDKDEPLPLADGLISGAGHDYVGFDVGASRDDGDDTWRTTYPGDTWHDMMTYCDMRWIAARTYEALFQPIPRAETTLRSLSSMAAPASGQQVLLVSGILDLTTGSFVRRPYSRLPGDLVSPRPAASSFNVDYTINLIDTAPGGGVTSYLFNPRVFTDQDPQATSLYAQVAEIVPWVDGTDTIEIRSGQTVLDTVAVSATPTVTLLAPNGGNTLAGGDYLVTWESKDADTAELTHTLLYSTDDGVTWQTAAGNITAQQYLVDTNRLPGSEHARFRVIVTDGVTTAQDDSDTSFTVADKAPRVDIVSPGDGATFTSASTVVLTGAATDIELGELDGAAMAWASDLQGPLGTGRAIGAPNLTPGVHTITLTANDGENPPVSTSITITVTDADPPHLPWPEAAAAPGVRQGQFVYDGDDGVGAFYTTDGAGGIQRVHGFDPLLSGLTAIVPGNFGGDDATDLLFYASQSGVGEFFASTGSGELQLLSGSEGFTRGWDIIVPGNFDADDDWTDLFFYNADAGEGKFYTTNGAGTIRLLGQPASFSRGWTSIVAGEFGGDSHTDLLFYDAATGLVQLSTTDGQGGLVRLGEDDEWAAGWDQIVTGNFGSRDGWVDLFVANAETGKAAFLFTDGTGTFAPRGEAGALPSHWTTVIGGEFGGDETLTDLFFYDASAGLGRYYTTDSQGGLAQLSSSDDYPTGWDQVVPGYFERS